MWFKRQTDLGRNIVQYAGFHEGHQPAFILEQGVDKDVWPHTPSQLGDSVALRATPGNQQVAGLYVAIAQTKVSHCRKMVGRPSLVGAPIAASLVSKQLALIGVGVVLVAVVIKKIWSQVKRCGKLCRGRFR